MKIALPLAVCVLLALAALVLALNYLEVDDYPYALKAPPSDPLNGSIPAWLPETLPHPCSRCEENTCSHDITLSRCEVRIAVVDRDGWYRLFWAEDDLLYYDDPVYFLEALKNPSTAGYTGTFAIEGKTLPAGHDHGCEGETTGSFRINYRLVESEEGLKDAEPSPDAPFPAPTRFKWMVGRRYRDGKEFFVDYGWERVSLDITPAPCGCGKP